MTRKTVLAIVLWGMCTGNTASAEIIHVPNDYSTIQSAINAAANGDEIIVAPGTYNELIDFVGKTITLRSSGGAGETTIDGQGYEGRVVSCMSGEGLSTTLEGFTIRGGDPLGGLLVWQSSARIIDCVFTENYAVTEAALTIWNSSDAVFTGCTFHTNVGSAGGALEVRDSSSALFTDCDFIQNTATGPGGALNMRFGSSVTFVGCRFIDNASSGGGAVFAYTGSEVSLINCMFRRNHSSTGGGGFFPADGSAELVNCTFDRNSSASWGGAMAPLLNTTQLTNCVFSGNIAPDEGGALYIEDGETTIDSSILWINGTDEIYGGPVTVNHSDVLGGWPGEGNIDADPLFVQPGIGDLRLSFDSPCVNAGNNDALPPDEFDLDEDGNTLEPIPIDLAGADRVQDGIVDMGAYEGEFDPQASADGVDDLDQGELAILLPCGGTVDLLERAVVIVTNESGPDNASFFTECIDWELHPDAGGFGELDTILRSTTSLQNGEFLMYASMPFDNDILQGRDPLMMNMTFLDPDMGDWRLAVAGNTQNSPGHEGPVGNRIVVENSENDFGLSYVRGDYGLFWNPSLQKGFVWANIDHAGDVAFGATLCQEDCGPIGGDGVMNAIDVQHLLGSWGPAGDDEPCDFDQDGQVGPFDLALLLHSWGPCSPGGNPAIWQPTPKNWGPCPQAASCVGDLNNDGQVGPLDLATIFGHWGPCAPKANCPADLDGDETVGRSDLALLLGEARFARP